MATVNKFVSHFHMISSLL